MRDLKQKTIQFEGDTYIHDAVVKALVETNEKLQARVKELEEGQRILTDYIELADEDGYIDGYGFVNIEKYKHKAVRDE